jgi:hypothetical protein
MVAIDAGFADAGMYRIGSCLHKRSQEVIGLNGRAGVVGYVWVGLAGSGIWGVCLHPL